MFKKSNEDGTHFDQLKQKSSLNQSGDVPSTLSHEMTPPPPPPHTNASQLRAEGELVIDQLIPFTTAVLMSSLNIVICSYLRHVLLL